MADFTYPYNFIRPGAPSTRTAPKPQAKFDGLSGTIHCKLVTTTPIFTPDAELVQYADVEVRGEKQIHRHLQFVQHGKTAEGKPRYLIPSTAIKGMVRSMAETLSGSCWSQFDGGKLPPWRPRPEWWKSDRKVRCPGMVVDADGQLLVKHMTEAWARLPGPREADDSSSGAAIDAPFPKTWLEQLTKVTVTVGPNLVPHRTADPHLECLSIEGGHVPIPAGALHTHHGYMKYVSQDGPKRHYQRVFIPWCASTYDSTAAMNPSAPVGDAEQALWTEATRDRKGNSQGPLREGCLVWYTVKTDGTTTKVESIGPVAIYKRANTTTRVAALRNIPGQVFEGHDQRSFLPCTHADQLCFCCRLFGFVRDGEGADNALAGRVAFSFARATRADELPIKPLRILGGPNPKFAPFYLQDGKPWSWEAPNSRLRGRKFYWHHQDRSGAIAYYEQPASPVDPKTGISPCPDGKSDQNATVTALKAKAVFTFEVDFWDLDEKQLGCLLMSLSLQVDDAEMTGLQHKFGMGKPVGLGSCIIEITSLDLIRSRVARYRADNLFLEADFARGQSWRPFLSKFRTHMQIEADGVEWGQLPQVSDAVSMWGPPPTLPVQYNPDPDHSPLPDGGYLDAGFAYFTHRDVQSTPLRSPQQTKPEGGEKASGQKDIVHPDKLRKDRDEKRRRETGGRGASGAGGPGGR